MACTVQVFVACDT